MATRETSCRRCIFRLCCEDVTCRLDRRQSGCYTLPPLCRVWLLPSIFPSLSLQLQGLTHNSLYFAFLRRPLQAGTYINAAAAKCLLLLSYPPTHSTPEDTERIRRIFWSCYILESDYLAELSVPLSGVGRIESSIPLPGNYPTHATPQEEEQSSLYFLACISMRRLLNRVHQLLYARDTGACESLDNARFPVVVAELDHQLEEWRDVLPAAFEFDVDLDSNPASEHGRFLRQRYLTCRSVIYRPYLMWMLSGIASNAQRASEEVLGNCKACLDACLLHILHLRGFAHTVLVDTWICSLSYVLHFFTTTSWRSFRD